MIKSKLFLVVSICCLYVFFIFLMEWAYMSTLTGIEYENNRLAFSMVNSSVPIVVLCFILLILWRRHDWRQDWRPINKTQFFKQSLLVVPLLLFSLGMSYLWLAFLSFISPDAALYLINDQSLNMTHADGIPLFLFLYFMALVVLAPLTEEVFFRALFFKVLSRRTGMIFSIILSSFLFGIIHLSDPIGAFVFGVVLCMVYQQTANIWYPIAIHAFNNAVVFIWIAYDVAEPFEPYTIEELREVSPWLLISGVIGLIWLTIYFYKNGSLLCRPKAPLDSNSDDAIVHAE